MRWREWLRFAAYLMLAIACVVVATYAGMAALARPRAYSGHFYEGLRTVVSAWAIFAATLVWVRFRNGVFLAFIGVAVLFNPVRQFFLSKATWSVIDLGIVLLSLWILMLCWEQIRKPDTESMR